MFNRRQAYDLRGSNACIARCSSRSFSLARNCASASLSSSTRNPPFELTIFDKSYSKYFPRRESRLSLASDCFGAVGDPEVAGMTSSGRLLLALVEETAAALCSRSRCFAFATESNDGCTADEKGGVRLTFQAVDLEPLDLLWSQFKIRRAALRWWSRRSSA